MDDFELINKFSVLSESLVNNKIDKKTFEKEVEYLAQHAPLPVIGEKVRMMGKHTIDDFEFNTNKKYLHDGNVLNISDNVVSEYD